MISFIILYFANLVLDYPLQDSFLKEYKQKNNYVLFVHCAIWGIGISIVLICLGMFAWWKLVMLVVGHYLIDYWKCRGIYKKWPIKHGRNIVIHNECSNIYFDDMKKPLISDYTAYYIDQFLHVIQLLICFI